MRIRHFIALFLVIFLIGTASSLGLATEGDVVFKRQGAPGGTPPAVFPHWVHRIRFKCYACHPGLFKIKGGGNKITMDAIMKGESCGTCHNGKIAWGVSFDTCNRCHVGKK